VRSEDATEGAHMNKAEIVARIARDAGLTKSDALKAIDALIDNVTRALKKGDKVTLVGFGTFAISRRKARTGRNPQGAEGSRQIGYGLTAKVASLVTSLCASLSTTLSLTV
jgi:DNA-binding protein HU-beta